MSGVPVTRMRNLRWQLAALIVYIVFATFVTWGNLTLVLIGWGVAFTVWALFVGIYQDKYAWWFSARFWLLFAGLCGAGITALGIFDTVYPEYFQRNTIIKCASCETIFREWAPHFGPELLILVFAAAVVDSTVSRRERANAIVRGALGGLLYSIRQCESRDMSFSGWSTSALEAEHTAAQQRLAERDRAFVGDERELYRKAMGQQEELVKSAQKFAEQAERRDEENARLKLTSAPTVLNALNDEVNGKLRSRTTTTPGSPHIDWNAYLNEFVQNGVSIVNDCNYREQLSNYIGTCSRLLEYRINLVDNYAKLRATYIALRQKAWGRNRPDEF